MAKINKIELTPTASKMEATAKEMGEARDCAVRALAVATGKTYKQAHKALAAAGRENGKGTTLEQVEKAALELGFKLENVGADFISGIIAQYPGVHKTLKHITTHHPLRFSKVWAEVTEPLMFHVNRHFAGYRKGALHDWSVNGARRVIDLYRLTPIAA